MVLIREKINQLTDKKVWLAPLAGVTDKSFRTICKQCGADVVVSEMVSADGLLYSRERSIKYAQFTEIQRPFGIQLFGSDPLKMAKAVEIILTKNPDFIDINMGCPVRKVIKKGAGAALMKRPEIAGKMVSEIKRALSGVHLPVSAKIRSGWDKFNINVIEFSRKLEDSGLDIICFHARTKSQMYSGHSDWSLIKKLKENISLPVVGNGDIRTEEDAIEMFSTTGCDSIMIGRGAIGKPWLFMEIKKVLKNEKKQDIDLKEKFNIIKEHCLLAIKDKGETLAIREMKTHLSNYTKGFNGSSKIRNYINRSFDIKEILRTIEGLYSE